MAPVQRLVSIVLLIAGVSLVFTGLTRSLGLTTGSVIASAAAIAALLYTGGVWFGSTASPAPASPVADRSAPILFDLSGRLIAGPAAGRPVASQFPESLRQEIERQCAAAFAGRAGRFRCERDGQVQVFDILPVLGGERTVVYGLIVPAVAEVAIAAAVV